MGNATKVVRRGKPIALNVYSKNKLSNQSSKFLPQNKQTTTTAKTPKNKKQKQPKTKQKKLGKEEQINPRKQKKGNNKDS